MLLSGFSPNSLDTFGLDQVVSNPLTRFNSLTGDWRINLIMSVLTEMIVVVIYMVAGVVIPLHKDLEVDEPPKYVASVYSGPARV